MNNYTIGKNLQSVEYPQTAARFPRATAGDYNKGLFVVAHLLVTHSAPRVSLFSFLEETDPLESSPVICEDLSSLSDNLQSHLSQTRTCEHHTCGELHLENFLDCNSIAKQV